MGIIFQANLDEIEFVRRADGTILNPRKRIRDTTDLQNSLSQPNVGQIDPIQVMKKDGKWWVKDGHRRVMAARALGWTTLRAEPVAWVDGEVDLLVQMLATRTREDLLWSELGDAIREVALDPKYGIERAAAINGISVADAQLLVDLLSAPDKLRKRVDSKEMSLSAWKAVRDKPKAVQQQAADLEHPTVKATKELVKQDKLTGFTDAMLNMLDAENRFITEFNKLKADIMSRWGGMSTNERARLTASVETLYRFMGTAPEAAAEEPEGDAPAVEEVF